MRTLLIAATAAITLFFVSMPLAAEAKATPTPSPTAHAVHHNKPKPKPKHKATPKPKAAPQVLLPTTGGTSQPGQWNSPTFNAPGHWKFTYSFDCTAYDASVGEPATPGNFQVYLLQGATPVAVLANELAVSGASKTVDEYNQGNGLHVEVNTECTTWSVGAVAA